MEKNDNVKGIDTYFENIEILELRFFCHICHVNVSMVIPQKYVIDEMAFNQIKYITMNTLSFF